MDALETFCQKAMEAKLRFDGLGMVNVYNRTPAELAAIDLAYRRAEKEWLAARAAYEAALNAAPPGF